MSITIDYAQFGTQTGDFPTAPAQPYQYSNIYNGITDLATDDRVIIFSGLPSGLRIASNPTTTQPYDSVFMDIGGAPDYILMNNTGSNTWQGAEDSNFICAYTSGGFWAAGEITNPIGVILTGLSGNANSSILDIEFTGLQEISVAFDNGDFGPSYDMQRTASYTFNVAAPSGSNIRFNQLTNDSWYPIGIITNSGAVFISGLSYANSGSSLLISNGFTGYVAWENNQLAAHSGDMPMPAPFNRPWLNLAFEWYDTVANELLSNYSVIANNSGNSGIGIIQLNQQAANGEQFSDLIPPLRKLHVAFTTG